MAWRRWRALAVPVLIGAVVTAAAPGWFSYRIRPGDTLSAIAARYHTSVAVLVALNHLPGNGNLIYAGALLKIPRPAPAEGPARGPAGATAIGSYRVVAGDTANGVAARFHTTLAWLARHDHLGPPYTIYVGQRLLVPVPVVRRPVVARDGAAAALAARVARDWATIERYPAPSAAWVRSAVVAAARRYGVPPSLALAVAWQESGFNQREVSGADAIGVMQVLPSTGAFVARAVAHRPLNLFRATDDITAGVGLLGLLVHAAPVGQAVAGYYQGLGSVRANGMYPDTKQYVADVLALRNRFA